MLRDKNLVPLSHQHLHALALCVRIERGIDRSPVDFWQAEIERQFVGEMRFHFAAEEQFLFPAAARFEAIASLVAELLGDHEAIRLYAAQAAKRTMSQDDVTGFAQSVSQHIRKEERQLFESCQQLMTAEELAKVGGRIDEYFRREGVAPNACAINPEKPQQPI